MANTIKEVVVQNHKTLPNQVWSPYSGLNVLTSNNGGGKTTLLEYIYAKYNRTHNIKALLTSIHNFKNYIEIKHYAKKNMRPPETRQFEEEYKTMLNLQADEALLKDCNAFLKKLKLKISLNEAVVKSGVLYFITNNGVGLSLTDISTGEKTAFILWLIKNAQKKPDVLILDEFDASMDDEIIWEFYKILKEISEETQIFIATHRKECLADDLGWSQISNNGKIGNAKLL